ncbi:MAG: histidine phosphatase family protein, partial [Parasporobacterium sp.]|nr:histidine phosphatase family protein [Parasporobacterium sp.]
MEAGTAKITATVTSDSGVKTALTAKVVVEKAEFTFYLTRHGQTLFNVRGVGQGWCDSPLTEDG